MEILIVEDEPVVARRLARLVEAAWDGERPRVRTVRTLGEARAFLGETPIDLLFLDLDLNGRDGFDLLRAAVAGAFHTVVVSAHTDRALEAFEYGVLDFVPKPFTAERLARAVARFRDARGRSDYAARYLAVRKTGGVALIPVERLSYVRAAGSYAELVLRDGTTALHDKSLDRLLAVLPPVFERIHRSYLVRMSDVARLTVEEGSRYGVVLHGGETLPVGRTRYKEIRARLEGGGPAEEP